LRGFNWCYFNFSNRTKKKKEQKKPYLQSNYYSDEPDEESGEEIVESGESEDGLSNSIYDTEEEREEETNDSLSSLTESKDDTSLNFYKSEGDNLFRNLNKLNILFSKSIYYFKNHLLKKCDKVAVSDSLLMKEYINKINNIIKQHIYDKDLNLLIKELQHEYPVKSQIDQFEKFENDLIFNFNNYLKYSNLYSIPLLNKSGSEYRGIIEGGFLYSMKEGGLLSSFRLSPEKRFF